MTLGTRLSERLGLRRRASAFVDRVGILRPLRVRDFALLWTGLALSFVGDGPAADAFGVDATLVAAGVLGEVLTLAFMLYPGARSPERDGSIEAVREVAVTT